MKRYFKYKNSKRESMVEGCIEKMGLEFIFWILYKGRSKEKKDYYNKILKKYNSKIKIINNQKELNKFINTYKV
ncbi:hypothetical protein [Miniphocaeibacter massiliensis]|uniref:hypothetical protein n=1 Tax=Miniphocaeibacter massiliensis TaxID=2041841 RepID=UPI001F5E2EBE|nr:hypothetical protein [Miniphocaeibacter massiliensis]